MSFTDDEIKRAADLKLWVESRIAELQSEIAKLQETLQVVDIVLRRASFRSAVQLTPAPTSARVEKPPSSVVARVEMPSAEVTEIRPLKRAKDEFLLANAYISSRSLTIIPVSDVELKVTTPPFKSFFMNKILEGMKAKDVENISQGKIKADEVINFDVEEENGVVKKVTINNYRDKTRLNEIVSTATWTFTRMLEKKA